MQPAARIWAVLPLPERYYRCHSGITAVTSRHRATRAEGEEVHTLGRYYCSEGSPAASYSRWKTEEGSKLSGSWSGSGSDTTADKRYYRALLLSLLPLPCVVFYGNPTRKIETTAEAVVPAALTSGTTTDRRYYRPGRSTTA